MPSEPTSPAPKPADFDQLTPRTLRQWQGGGPNRALAALVGLVILAAVGSWAVFVTVDHDRTVAETEHELWRLTGLLEEHARRTMEAADLTLRQLESEIDDRPVDALRESPTIYASLTERAGDLAQVGSLYVLNTKGEIVASSLQEGPLPGDYRDRAYFQAHLGPDAPDLFIGEILVGRVTGLPFFSISRAIRDGDGTFKGLLVAAIHTDYFSDFYEKLGLGVGGSVGILRRDGAVLVREPQLSDPVGHRVEHMGDGLTPERPYGTFQRDSQFDGEHRIVAQRLVTGYPLIVAASRMTDVALEGWRSRLRQTGIAVALIALAAGMVGVFGLRGLRRQRLMAEALLEAQATLERRVEQRTAELAKANDDLSVAVEHKNLLLREVYHRVKNNLQQVDALIAMQMRRAPEEARPMLNDTRRRINALGLVHQQLLQSVDYTTFSLRSFLEDLCESLAYAMGGRQRGITLRCEADPVPIDLDVAIPLGLLINELVSNAFKHAFPDGRTGTIVVTARQSSEYLTLVVRDDGVGYDTKVPNAESVGTQIVQALTAQLRAQRETVADKGTTVTFRVPVQRGE